MKKSILLGIGFIVSLNASSIDLNITNECKGLEIRDLHFGIIEKDWQNNKSTELQYGLKNLTTKTIKNIRMTVYLKDNDNNRIFEETYSEKDLKPHYEMPLNKARYWGISPLPKDFANKADLVVKCDIEENINKAKQSETDDKKVINFYIDKELFQNIKENTKTKSDLEARASIGMAIKILEKYKTINNLVDALEGK